MAAYGRRKKEKEAELREGERLENIEKENKRNDARREWRCMEREEKINDVKTVRIWNKRE